MVKLERKLGESSSCNNTSSDQGRVHTNPGMEILKDTFPFQQCHMADAIDDDDIYVSNIHLKSIIRREYGDYIGRHFVRDAT